jgi:2-polyprenyl-3-methyl-5-hydroxy-6-metoxy-1,4-benzoquinol methylase
MHDSRWEKDNLRKLIIEQGKEYKHLGLEIADNDQYEIELYKTWLPHRLKTVSLIPEECRNSNTKAIDIGGGNGKLCNILSVLGLRCLNVDHLYSDAYKFKEKDHSKILKLESYLSSHNIDVAGLDINVDKFPFPDNSFDLAISTEVIEHLPNSPKPMLSEIYRILKPNGYFILTTPNQAALGYRIKALLGHSTRDYIVGYYDMNLYPAGTAFRGHIREYTLNELKYMLQQENFKIIKVTNFSLTPDFALFKEWRNYISMYKVLIFKFIDYFLPMLSNYFFILNQK